jgi:hypothetical protein
MLFRRKAIALVVLATLSASAPGSASADTGVLDRGWVRAIERFLDRFSFEFDWGPSGLGIRTWDTGSDGSLQGRPGTRQEQNRALRDSCCRPGAWED